MELESMRIQTMIPVEIMQTADVYYRAGQYLQIDLMGDFLAHAVALLMISNNQAIPKNFVPLAEAALALLKEQFGEVPSAEP